MSGIKKENVRYLKEQIITYIGNKRDFLSSIEKIILEVKQILKKESLVTLDLFSGSGVVARLLKSHSSLVIANDLEKYSYVINDCYLSNYEDFDELLFNRYLNIIEENIIKELKEGIITKYYAPKNDDDITLGERVFYTRRNALYIDSFRYYLDIFVPDNLKKYFLGPLLYECSVHVNTCGVFKGFYKDCKSGIGKFGGDGENALSRIKGEIKVDKPVLSAFSCDYVLYMEDATQLVERLKDIDLAYLDPPYNEHPYGSNYFMLNVILNNEEPKNISKISGIPKDWNRSTFNKKKEAFRSLEAIIGKLDAKFILLSYNDEGIISYEEMIEMLKKYGELKEFIFTYNTFRGSRNLNKRNVHTHEYLFLLDRRNELFTY